MECGKLTAKLRDAVPVIFIEEGCEPKRFKNIEIPDEIKEIEYKDFKFDVPDNGQITFKIWFEQGMLPTVWPEARVRKTRMKTIKADQETLEPATMAEQLTDPAPITIEDEQKIDEHSHIARTSDENSCVGMEVNFNVVGDRRKELVAAIGAFLNIKPKYTPAPKYGFVIGEYEVSRYGILTGPENPRLIAMLNAHGFTAD